MINNLLDEDYVTPITLYKCRDWHVGNNKIYHTTNRYFSLMAAKTSCYERLMINQPEVGLLGFIATNSANREWLVQNKPEPGNMYFHQLAPTVQATKSNYERTHGGKETPFLSMFDEPKNNVIDVEQSEQGSKFLNKFNRNCKVLVDDKALLNATNGYEWFTTLKIKEQLQKSFVLNTDARSVLTCGHWDLLANNKLLAFSTNPLLSRELSNSFNKSYQKVDGAKIRQANLLLKKMHQKFPLPFHLINFSNAQYIEVEEAGVTVNDKLSARFFDIHLSEREISHWQQPLLVQEEQEHCLLLFSIVDNTAIFYISVYPELGFNNRAEFGPSVQTGIDRFKSTLEDFELLLEQSEIILQIEQSDEGGRFYKNICNYTLAHWTLSPSVLTQENGIWLTAGEIELLSCMKGKLTNELRTQLSLLLSYI